MLTSPLFAFIAWRIRLRLATGPVFFRQERLGQNMQPFTVLKFRTMKRRHRRGPSTGEYIERDDGPPTRRRTRTASTSSSGTTRSRASARCLRKTSLDELPQLLNVLRGEMSLVGPRPCLAYETETFAPHHFERFLVPPGMTGLWQVTARAHSTFGEALDMDVAYARGWSLGLDLRLLLRTPLADFVRPPRGDPP